MRPALSGPTEGTKKGRSPIMGLRPFSLRRLLALFLGSRTHVGRRWPFNWHSRQMRLGGLVVARHIAGRALARRDELVDERERRGSSHAQH
jgi:hypothetical protein